MPPAPSAGAHKAAKSRPSASTYRTQSSTTPHPGQAANWVPAPEAPEENSIW